MIEFSCTMDYKSSLSFFIYSQKKSSKLFKVMGWVFAILGTIYLISTFMPPIIEEDLLYDIFISIILIFCGLFFAFFFKKMLLKSFNNSYKTNKFLQTNPTLTFQFNDTNYKVLTASPLGMEDCTYSYEMIKQITETNDLILIYISNNSAYIINKEQLTVNIVIQLRNFLRSKTNYFIDIEKKKVN